MPNAQPADYKTYFIDLPLARLRVLEVGSGAPLILVPATLSFLEEWSHLAQFMAQWFHVYFFELPGHGGSSPFQAGFSGEQVALLVEELVDHLGFGNFNLMGFSFGGILAMRTYTRLANRIDRLVLIAPCLSYRALPLSSFRRSLLFRLNRIFSHPYLRARFCDLIHNERTVLWVARLLQKMGRLESTSPLAPKLLVTREGTIAVVNAQIDEILTTEFQVAAAKYSTPCYFAMSLYDPLIMFEATQSIVHQHFVDVSTLRLTYPFHQPPQPFTFAELNRDFFDTVNAFMHSEKYSPKT